MKTKNIFLLLAITTLTTSCIHAEEANTTDNTNNNDVPQLTFQEQLIRRAQGLPGDPNKTPTDPDVVENHKDSFLGLGQNFYRKRIFFPDKDGKMCYKRILGHEKDNPEFGDVTLAIYHETYKGPDTIEIIGKYADEKARAKFIASITNGWFSAGKGGVWYPEQKTFVGGTRNKNIGAMLAARLAQPEQLSKFSKIKK
jgi:hypothetical protein